MSTIMPPVRTPASYQVLPDGCSCTWAWRTSTDPWRWVLTVPHPSCPHHGPGEGTR